MRFHIGRGTCSWDVTLRKHMVGILRLKIRRNIRKLSNIPKPLQACSERMLIGKFKNRELDNRLSDQKLISQDKSISGQDNSTLHVPLLIINKAKYMVNNLN